MARCPIHGSACSSSAWYNTLVMALNHGMPVSADALVRAGFPYPGWTAHSIAKRGGGRTVRRSAWAVANGIVPDRFENCSWAEGRVVFSPLGVFASWIDGFAPSRVAMTGGGWGSGHGPTRPMPRSARIVTVRLACFVALARDCGRSVCSDPPRSTPPKRALLPREEPHPIASTRWRSQDGNRRRRIDHRTR